MRNERGFLSLAVLGLFPVRTRACFHRRRLFPLCPGFSSYQTSFLEIWPQREGNQNNVAFGRPILVNDMFEHAYHMDFGSNAAMYVDAFMQNVNWDEANRRYEEARKVFAAIKA